MLVIKRNGTEVEFSANKIYNAIKRAAKQINSEADVKSISDDVCEKLSHLTYSPNVEYIQDIVVHTIFEHGEIDLGIAYFTYRYQHTTKRTRSKMLQNILSLLENKNEAIKQENSNKNPMIASTQRDYMAGEVSKEIARTLLISPELMDAHDKGIIHIHDLDYQGQPIHNCSLVNLKDMLDNGTAISGVAIDSPHRLKTAANIATQIVAQVASSQYGGQTISLAHLVPYVEKSRQYYMDVFNGDVNKTEQLLQKEIEDAMQTIQYQLVTLMTTNGQTPFVTVYMDLEEVEPEQQKDMARLITEVLRQRIKGVKNKFGNWIAPAFPKLIFALNETSMSEEYEDLLKLSIECTAKRMVPDYISAKMMKQLKGDVYPCMGCRSFLTPDQIGGGYYSKLANADPVERKYYGRFNQGVVTLNLLYAALESGGDEDKFWKLMEHYSEDFVHKALRMKHERLLGTPSDVAPIIFQDGACARLKPGQTIDKLLYDGYSTISFGYCALYETTKYMTGESHTNPKGHDFAMRVMHFINDKCAKWREAENIAYSIYGTPLESTTYKFAKCLQEQFGIIPKITEYNYVTNSYHVNVREKITAFDKLSFEAPFQELSPGGAISYVEVPHLFHNLKALETLVRFIYETIIYAEINTKIDKCNACGYEGTIEVIEDDSHKLKWRCPNCGSMDQSKLTVVRRTCGYIGSQFWNQGRTQEIKDRVLHL